MKDPSHAPGRGEPAPLTLNGKPFSPSPACPTVSKIVSALSRLADNELLNVAGVCRHADVGACAVRKHARSKELEGYVERAGSKGWLYFGNRKAIAQLRKQIGGA